MNTLLLAVLLAAPASAAPPDFEASLRELRTAVLAQPPLAAARPPAKPAAKPAAARRVTDAAAWTLLLDRARGQPTRVLEVRVGPNVYRVSVLVSDEPVEDRQCAEGSQARNTLFVTDPPGTDVYPVRLTATCVGPAGTLDRLAGDADAAGGIKEMDLYDPSKDLFVHSATQPLTPAQLVIVQAYLSRLVRIFLEVP